jgi:ribulose-phosphate 3-epimerase
MSEIVPTILANSEQYEGYILDYCNLVNRLHIDLTDGDFSPSKTLGIDEIFWPYNITADLHVMYKNPQPLLEEILTLSPNLVIVHSEADLNFENFALSLRNKGIKFGLALLADSPVNSILDKAGFIDHVLIFSGNLGHYGGVADLSLLNKIPEIKKLGNHIEIGWDGGINPKNVKTLADAGVDVLNVGGFIAGAESSRVAYRQLTEAMA